MARSRRVKREKFEIGWELARYATRNDRPALPCVVTLTRLGPSPGLDDDNLAGALKATRDAIAAWLGVDDKKIELVRYQYAQAWAPAWGVRIEFTNP